MSAMEGMRPREHRVGTGGVLRKAAVRKRQEPSPKNEGGQGSCRQREKCMALLIRKGDGKCEAQRKSAWLEGRQRRDLARSAPIQQKELSSLDFPRSSEKPKRGFKQGDDGFGFQKVQIKQCHICHSHTH